MTAVVGTLPRPTRHCELVLPADAPRDEWLEMRRTGIGASEASGVAGLNPWATPLSVWLDKLDANPLSDRDNEAMEFGRELEPVVANAFARRTGKRLTRVGLVRSLAWPWMLASCDRRVVGESALVEVKGLALDTPIPTPGGWSSIRDIQVGDELFAANGSPCRVTGKSEVKWVDCFRVLFDDGTSIVCDADHRWPVLSGPMRSPTRQILDTRTIAATLRGRDGQRQHRILLAGPIDTPRVELPVEPYTLGCWLGDGSADCGRISKPDVELFELITAASGLAVGPPAKSKKSCPTRTVYGLSPLLRSAGLLNDKHIPNAYQRAAAEQRLSLLQGLMDTDGTWASSRRQAVFCSVEKSLAAAVFELVAGLGERPVLTATNTRGFGKDVTMWRVQWRPVRWNPFRLARKADHVVIGGTKVSNRRMVVSVEPIPVVPTQCLIVDSADHTYLCGHEFVPTHNTTAWYRGREWDDDEVPDHALLQAHHQMAVTGMERVYVPVLIGGQHFEYRVVERDEQAIADLVEVTGRFWRDNVLGRVEPTARAADLPLLESRRGPAPTNPAVVGPDALLLLRQRAAAARDKTAADKRHKELTAQLVQLLGDHDAATTGDGEVAFTYLPRERSASAPTTYRALTLTKHGKALI